MKQSVSVIVAVLLIIFAALLEKQGLPSIGGSPVMQDDGAKETSGQVEQHTPYSELTYVLEERIEVDGNIVETYREYELYEDKNGHIRKRVPTENLQYMTYKKNLADRQ
ncbi:hypothetical protein GCM10007216_06490 [Thalassobacillus devorans]|uniref:DUF1093 domain-containing protein n=1 Tax=Thalassobacillus devorans TaxID=279813 RepID=A0ABQ1NJD9_9BACI|nr:hypothetical protein [Thalassobacillus devorans]NIK27559.1 uncharacterized protein YdeI (BOF family) [Thalassobacillus devorans]GGC78696.1 hypothetical protein GCM10007216_06490 [Thalassobacillus devorans]